MTDMHPDTILAYRGRPHPGPDDPRSLPVNPPVSRASTVLFPSMAVLHAPNPEPWNVPRYGRYGTETHRALEDAVSALEGGFRTLSTPSGLAAITCTMMALAKAGGHALLVDCCYHPARAFAEKVLRPMGMEVEFFRPSVGADIARLLRPETCMVLVEAPGSQSFEMQDIPAIAAACRAAGVPTLCDNTWASPLYFQPLKHGIDVSIQAGTKYVVGHSDAMLGLATAADEAMFRRLFEAYQLFGYAVGPDDASLALRGLRTLSVRLERHHRNALKVAEWLQDRPEVQRVLFPALPDDPGHALWKRDFSGASGLFGVLLHETDRARIAALVDGMRYFGMGFSWGGYESLIVPQFTAPMRTHDRWPSPTTLLRIHVGLEDPDDLIGDLEAGFGRMTS